MEASPVSQRQLSPQRATLPSSVVARSMADLAKSVHTFALLLLLVVATIFLLLLDISADVFQKEAAFPMVPVVVTSVGLSFFSIGVLIALGTHVLPSFHVLDHHGGEAFFALQTIGFLLCFGSMWFKLIFVFYFRSAAWYGALGVLGGAAAIGNLLYCWSLLCFIVPCSSDGNSTADPQRATPSETPTQEREDTTVSLAKPYLGTVATLFLYLAARAVHYLSGSQSNLLGLPLDTLSASAVPELLAFLMFVMPPATHFQGRLLFGGKFEVWNPFGGSGLFIFLQFLSWTSYGLGVLAFTAHISQPERSYDSLLVLTTLLLVSQGAMQASIRCFDPSQRSPSRARFTAALERGEIAGMNTVERSSLILSGLLNGELLLSLMLAGAAIALRFLCDVKVMLSLDAFPLVGGSTNSAIGVSNLLSLLAVPIAQYSSRPYIAAFFMWSECCVGYVLLVSLGWMAYICEFGFIAYQWEGWSSQSLTTAEGSTFSFYYTFQGFLYLIPLASIICGLAFELVDMVRRAVRAWRVGQSLSSLRQWGESHAKLESQEFETLLSELATVCGCVSSPTSSRRYEELNTDSVVDAAYYLTGLTIMLSTTLFLCGALLSKGSGVSFIFGGTGLMTVTFSCCNLQYSYGHRLHDNSGGSKANRFQFFTPFRGGRKFVIKQALGWSAYTMSCFVMIAAIIEGSVGEAKFIFMAATSGMAQVLILRSIGCFDVNKATPNSVLARSAEGLLAASILAGTFFFSQMYQSATRRRWHGEGESGNAWFTHSPVSVALSALSVCTAVPMGLIALQRQAQYLHTSSRGTGDEECSLDHGESEEGTPMQHAIWLAFCPPCSRRDLLSEKTSHDGEDNVSSPASPRPQSIAYSLSRVLAVLFVYMVPFVFFFLFYSYQQRLLETFQYGVAVMQASAAFFAVLVGIPSIVMLCSHYGRHTFISIAGFASAWFFWSIPTIVVVGGLSPPFIIATSGTWLWFTNMTIMCCLSPIPHLPLIMFAANTAAVGFFATYHLYFCRLQGAYEWRVGRCAGDLLLSLFWVWYDTRYFGQPHVSGRLLNPMIRRFCRRYLFNWTANYFKLQVIKTDPYTLPDEKPYLGDNPAPSVDRSQPSNQYLFSFHPHGVFPGSSLYAPCTPMWEDVVGTNEKSVITTHCADVVFVSPFLRELPLGVGALSVGRKGIEKSISRGNSPLIITGGQSEMLFTKWSSTEMHLVCHHVGFIRIAMRHRLPLVPILSFSECNIMENVHWLSVQRWFLKRVGFPAIVLPHGWCYLPLPTRLPVTLVVGQPIMPFPGRDDADDPSCLEELRARYFNHLQHLFYRYRSQAGYPNMNLYLHNGFYETVKVPSPSHTEDED